jgi:tRNA dimethylallyltransferase
MNLYFLIGPTASGKSDLALEWARRNGAEILYCDAFCVYRGMDVGTAKPDMRERAIVPHHGIDLCEVCRAFSVADYVAEARRVVSDCQKRGAKLLVSGGSGFYLKSFFTPVLDTTPVPDDVRAAVRGMYENGGLAAIVGELVRLSGGVVSGIDLKNPRRVQNALERCMASGKTLTELQKLYRGMPEPFADCEKKLCLLSRSPEDLWNRIVRRTKKMLEAGLVDEVKMLRAKGLEINPSAASAIGYREVMRWLDSGGGDLNALADEIVLDTRQYVKKQRNFFRNQLPAAKVVELSPDSGVEKVGELFD